MEAMRNYLIAVIMTAVICSLILNLLKDLKIKQLGRLICGVVLTLTIVRPVTRWNRVDLTEIIPTLSSDAQELVASGEEFSHQMLSDIIKLETEAYILSKAAELNADISVNIVVERSSIPVPTSIEIVGDITPYSRLCLEKILEDDLGILKENQLWNG